MQPADFYSGIVVDVYAHLKSTSFDPMPFAEFVRMHGQPALEIGCGEGEPLLALCAAGLEVDGVDASLDMVQRCRANAEERRLATNVFHQRAEQLDLPRRYASIYFAGPTFNLIPDDNLGLSALRRIRAHLADGGAALVPLWMPDQTPESALGVTLSSQDGAAQVRYTPLSETYDALGRTRVTSCRYELERDGKREVAEREWLIHWQTPESMRDLCRAAGLDVVSLTDDDAGAPVSASSTSFTATLTAATP